MQVHVHVLYPSIPVSGGAAFRVETQIGTIVRTSKEAPGDAAVKCYYYLPGLIGLRMDRFIGAAQLRQLGNTRETT